MSQTKIVRTPTRAEGGITPDEKRAMEAIAQKWIARAFRTDPIERDKITDAIVRLYAAAGLQPPRVVIAPSPLVMAFAYGAAAATWERRQHGGNGKTYAATDAATYDATDDATYDATDAATRAATRAATHAATDAATYDATAAATDSATDACYAIAGTSGLRCASRWAQAYQGGNMWASFCAYAEAMRDVLKLKLPQFEKYQAWEDAAIHGGFRVMHPEFCIVSDFPAEIHVDEQNRPHNDHGPSHRWRDGWALYHVHGVRVDDWIVEHPERITVQAIESETNAEVRRVMTERYGTARYLLDSGAVAVATDDYGVLYRKEVPDDEPIVMVRVLNTTPEPDGSLSRAEAERVFGASAVQRSLDIMRSIGHPVSGEPRWKDYMLRVPPTAGTAHEAVAWTFGKSVDDYAPSIES